MEPADEAHDGADETAEPTTAELTAYIHQLLRHIERLQQENRDLLAEVQAYQRRELELIRQRQ